MRLTWIVAIALIVAGVCASGARAAEEGIPDPRAEALTALRKESAVSPQVRFDGGMVRSAQIRVPVQDKDPERAAEAFLAGHRDLYGIEDTGAFYVRRVVRDEDGAHVFLGQRRDDVRVLDAELSIHIRDGDVVATAGAYVADVPASTEPVVTSESAKARAVKAAGGAATTAGVPRLAFYAPGLADPEPAPAPAARLIWRMTIVTDSGAFETYVDALNGRVLRSVATARDSQHLAIGSNNNGGTFGCAFLSHSGWFDEHGALANATPDNEGIAAFNNARTIYDWWFNQLGRDSWDGLGGVTRDELHDGAMTADKNAAFVPFCGHFIFGDNMATLDVMAHELAHGVDNKTANLHGGDQQDALNESYSDVFASLLDGNWTIGEGSARGIMRSLASPGTDRMSKFMPGGDPHANGGITNKAAFLIAMGGTQNGITVNGIGRTKLMHLYYDVLTTWLPSNATFSVAADVTTAAATVDATTGRYGFTPADACVVANAFAAVELRVPDADCDGNPDASDPDDDNDTIADTSDNCPGVANPGQLDTDHDGLGDACDGDVDNDTIANAIDNCRTSPNPSQADLNHDGIGDACSDLDGDGVKDATDNCTFNRNAGQEDRDGDRIGDACDDDDDGDGIRDVADNCRTMPNASQADGDGDLVGDACDGCPNDANVGDRPDGDGIDSACDPDDDNDGVLDGADNCPSVANADQRDMDRNGVGTACDPGETVFLDPYSHILKSDVRFRLEREQVVHLPIRVLYGPDPCDLGDPGCAGEIRVDTVFDTGVRIVDDSGAVVAQDEPGRNHVLRFAPGGDTIMRRPGGDRGEGASARSYWLDIVGTGDRGPKLGKDAAVVIATGP